MTKALTLALALSTAALAAAGQDFPAKPVTLVVAAPPGGATDRLAAVLAERLTEVWKHPVRVDHKPGRNTITATEVVAKSAPDGHTMVIVPTTTFVTNPLMTGGLPYDPAKDLAPVTEISRFPLGLYAHPSFSANDATQLIALGKSAPDKLVAPTLSTALALGLLDVMAGTKSSYVPMKGGGQPWAELIAGNISLSVDPLLPGMLEGVRKGNMKLLATLDAEPTEMAPATPPLSKAVPGYDMPGSFGIWVQGATPKDVKRRIQDDLVGVLKRPDVVERLRAFGQRPIGSSTQEYESLLARETQKWAPVVKTAGLKLE